MSADIKDISSILAEISIPDNALQPNNDSFINVYRFVTRYLIRYHKTACKVLFTLSVKDSMSEDEFDGICDCFLAHAKGMMRKSDLVMQYQRNQVFVFLTDIREEAVKASDEEKIVSGMDELISAYRSMVKDIRTIIDDGGHSGSEGDGERMDFYPDD